MNSIDSIKPPVCAVWGLAGTLVWGVVIAVVYVYAQVVGMGVYISMDNPGAGADRVEQLFAEYGTHGIALSVGVIVSGVVCLPLIAAAIKLKRNTSLRAYLGLELVGRAVAARWLLALCLLAIVFDLLLWLLGRSIVPEFSQDIYRSVDGAWPLWLAIVLVAPVVEEVFFRGFLFPGLAASLPGPVGATVITALVWAAFHIQYDLLLIGYIFLIGLLLGWARHRTGSILLTIAMHVFLNLCAMLLTAYTVSG